MFELDDIRKLLDAFESSDWDEIHLVADGVEIHLSTDPAGCASPSERPLVAPTRAVAATPPAAAPPAAAAPAATPAASGPAAPPVSPRDPARPAADAAPVHADPVPALDGAEVEGLHEVVSPSPGIFWRAPAPGEPPFVEVGQSVTPDSPIGIVEVMKLMNQVLAGVEGTVRAVLVDNGARVERHQAMVLIEPAA